MFNSRVTPLALFVLLFAGDTLSQNFSLDGTFYEFVDVDEKNSVQVSLNDDGSGPIQLSDDDLATLAELLSHDVESKLATWTDDEQKEELAHTAEQIESETSAAHDGKASANPGVVLRLTDKGFNYGTQIGTRLLDNYIRTMTIPDFEDNGRKQKVRVYNIRLTQFTMPALGYRLIGPNSLAFQSNSGSIAIRGDFKIRKKVLFFWVSVSGWFEASVSNLGINIQTQLNKNAQGKPQMSNVRCNTNIGSLRIRIHGAGIVGWVVNLFHGMIERYLKRKVEDTVSKKIIQYGNERGNAFLSNMATDVRLFNGLSLNYGLTGSPNVHPPFFDLPLKGETTINGASGTPFSPNPLELPPTDRKMAAIFMSDYVINSFLYEAHKAGLCQFPLDKNRNIANFLRTNCNGKEICIGKLIPALQKKYPNTVGRLFIRTSTPPTMQFMRSRANFVADATAEMAFGSETVFSFKVHGDFDLNSVQVGGAENRITARAGINDLKVTDVHSSVPDLGAVGDLIAALVRIGRPIAELMLNELGQKGFPLPAWRGLQLRNIDTSFLSHTLMVACDIYYPN